jgi:uroporphyrinogen decarboxylase
MNDTSFFSKPVRINGEGFLSCLRREKTPDRVYNMEILLDQEIEDTVARRFGLTHAGFAPENPLEVLRRRIAVHRFLGYDYLVVNVDNFDIPLDNWVNIADTADLERQGGRHFIDEHRGPIGSWDDFEKYPWPDPSSISTRTLEWASVNLPDDMILIGGLTAHFAEEITWLMGYEPLCIALCERRDLVTAIAAKLRAAYSTAVKVLLQFDRVKAVWGTDDMGFKTGPLIGPADMREFVLSSHAEIARMCHEAGRLYLLHSCGKLDLIMGDLIGTVGIDAKHSFEDTIENVTEAKHTYGRFMSLIGGIDMDFLCRATENEIRARVRGTLEICQCGGGYFLGTGNSVANYIPLENYLVMLDEGRRWEEG